MTDIRRVGGPHCFVADLARIDLDPDDRHHLTRSLRMRPGDAMSVSDGAGSWRAAVFGDIVEASGPIHATAPPRWKLSLGVALAKGAKPELVVQKATELGVDRIVVFRADRSVPRWDRAKVARNLERLDRVAREAAMQSRRVRIPQVDYADSLAEMVAATEPCSGPAAEIGWARADFGGEPIGPGHRHIAIGPEGGWSDCEQESVEPAVDLGPTVLRAETAGIVAAAAMTGFRTWSDSFD